MAYQDVPKVPRKAIARAGEILANGKKDTEEYREALVLAEAWRASHSYVLNTFNATIRHRLRRAKFKAIVAQRLKRMPTIIDKLARHPNMKLNTMQDIAGIRIILNKWDDLERIKKYYTRQINADHTLIKTYDYIWQPRNDDGYRSYHLVFKYNNDAAKNYNGLSIEIQIRTMLQHRWATAVETMGTIIGQALKSRQGDKNWIDFFSLMSSVYSIKEKLPIVPQHAGLKISDLSLELSKLNKQLKVIQKMSGLTLAVDGLSRKKYNINTYHLIILDSDKRTVRVQGFKKEQDDEAISEYEKYEKMAADGNQIEPVLVKAGSISNIRRAFPNFFLDINQFLSDLKTVVSTKSVKLISIH